MQRADLNPVTIAVSPAAALAARPRLFAALAEACGVSFHALTRGDSQGAVIEVRGVDTSSARTGLARPGAPTLVIGDRPTAEAGDPVTLADEPEVDRRLRGVTLQGQRAATTPAGAAPDERVLAGAGAGARWTVSGSSHAPVHRVAASLDELSPGDGLRTTVFPAQALSVIAVVQFLRALSRTSHWQAPPLRAAFVFDDPNLRRQRYGFIDYAQLVDHADAHAYHAAMAIVPSHATRADKTTAALFRRRADRVSLVPHGNNHYSRELMLPPDYDSALAVCAQAMRRITAFERRTGVRVDKVMMPPHGMCAQTVTSALGALGYDALCALHAVPWSEHPPADRPLSGWDAATFAGPSAVIPRFPLTVSQTEIALRAFMDQPLVLYGHHEDLASGLDPLALAAERVNLLGEVQWTSLGTIAASNYALRLDGDALSVRPFAGRLHVPLPEAARTLIVHRPRDTGDALLGWSIGEQLAPFDEPVAVSPGRTIEVRLRPRLTADAGSVTAPARSPWPTVRRVATEFRDRTMPLRSTLARNS